MACRCSDSAGSVGVLTGPLADPALGDLNTRFDLPPCTAVASCSRCACALLTGHPVVRQQLFAQAGVASFQFDHAAMNRRNLIGVDCNQGATVADSFQTGYANLPAAFISSPSKPMLLVKHD